MKIKRFLKIALPIGLILGIILYLTVFSNILEKVLIGDLKGAVKEFATDVNVPAQKVKNVINSISINDIRNAINPEVLQDKDEEYKLNLVAANQCTRDFTDEEITSLKHYFEKNSSDMYDYYSAKELTYPIKEDMLSVNDRSNVSGNYIIKYLLINKDGAVAVSILSQNNCIYLCSYNVTDSDVSYDKYYTNISQFYFRDEQGHWFLIDSAARSKTAVSTPVQYKNFTNIISSRIYSTPICTEPLPSFMQGMIDSPRCEAETHIINKNSSITYFYSSQNNLKSVISIYNNKLSLFKVLSYENKSLKEIEFYTDY